MLRAGELPRAGQVFLGDILFLGGAVFVGVFFLLLLFLAFVPLVCWCFCSSFRNIIFFLGGADCCLTYSVKTDLPIADGTLQQLVPSDPNMKANSWLDKA